MPDKTYDFTTEDVEYLRHGERALRARLYRPRGNGPFPAIVDLHGGAWDSGDVTGSQGLEETLARHGFLVASLNFRQAADGYPSSLIDINYAIRRLKAQARDLGIRPDLVGIAGQSSGGHLAMLAAMRPHDPRYTAIALPAGSPAVDARVRAVALSPRHTGGNAAEPAGLRDRHERKTRHLLEERGQYGRGQSDADPRARRKGRDATGPVGAGPARRGARLPRPGFGFPRQRAGAVRLELPQGRRRYRDRLCRSGGALLGRLLGADRRLLP